MTDTKNSNLVQRIRRYYELVDQTTQIGRSDGVFKSDDGLIAEIMPMFAKNAVYERQSWPEPFTGRDAIEDFFSQKRPLCGAHHVEDKDITVTPGIDTAIANRVRRHFPTLNEAACTSVTVSGAYIGANCFTSPGDERFTQGVAGMQLGFKDHWLFEGDKILYRYSDIEPLVQQRITPKQSTTDVGRS